MVQNTGTTSVGILSTKKQSKAGEDLDFGFQSDYHSKKVIKPSPQVALNKRRIPRKEPSKASKSSSKKSNKKRRVPKKYVKPNMTREKVSNKSLVNNDTGNKDLLSSAKEDRRQSIQSELKKPTGNKASARFTITKDKILARQGIIEEDQNEDYISDEGEMEIESDSDDSETVSSAEENKYEDFSITSSKELQPPMLNAMVKCTSEQPKKQMESLQSPIVSPPMNIPPFDEKPMKRQIHMLSPLPDIHANRQSSKSEAQDDRGSEVEGPKKSAPRITKSQTEFFTDLALLKNKSVAEKSKKVASRLKMMI